MFKKRFLTVGATFAALIAVVGAGFSSWYFSNQRRADLSSVGVIVTHANTFGQFVDSSITTPPTGSKFMLMLDQPASGVTGISMRKGTDENSELVGNVEATWEVSLSSYNDTLGKVGASETDKIANSYIEYSVLVYIKTETLGKYITVGAPFSTTGIHDHLGDHTHEKYTAYKYNLTTAGKVQAPSANDTTTGAYVTIGTDKVTARFVLNTADIAYAWQTADADAGTKAAPTSFQEYQDMVKTITSATTVAAGTKYESAGQDVIIEFAVFNAKPGVPNIDATNNT